MIDGMNRVMKKRLLLAAATLGLCLSMGCQWLAPETRSRGTDIEAMDTSALKQEYARVLEDADRLQAQLSERELSLAERGVELETQLELNRLLREELDATTLDLEFLEAQFITFERELTNTETKASAVAVMAEVSLTREKILKEDPGAIPADVLRRVDLRLAAAEEQMSNRNFGAAAYHARRGLRLVIQTERRYNAFLETGEPRVVSVGKANLRDAPDPDSVVLAQIPHGTILVELGQREAWRLVRMRDGVSGWVHVSLIQ
jgi:hypothetical protein